MLQDRKFVVILSSKNWVTENEYTNTGKFITIGSEKYEILLKKEKLKFINDFHINMGGVDIFDQKVQYYDTNRKSARWTFKLTLAVINMFAVNMHILTKEKNILDLSRHDFHLFLSKWFIDNAENYHETNNIDPISSSFVLADSLILNSLSEIEKDIDQVHALNSKKTGKKPKSEIIIQ